MRDKDHVVVLFYNFYEDTTFLLSSIYRSDEAYITLEERCYFAIFVEPCFQTHTHYRDMFLHFTEVMLVIHVEKPSEICEFIPIIDIAANRSASIGFYVLAFHVIIGAVNDQDM
jgi:hypothetical protein